ncbi:MAG TPA: hypothetical protein VEG26_08925 [Steroidobacteraceae bacterium]|nr:hypothetical protein [Steroidobacteraceae bacterium]
MKAARLLLWLAPLTLAAAGCHPFRHFTYACHKTQPYMEATSIPPLKVPPGMDAPDRTNALRLPQLNEPAPPPRKGQEPCLDEPPPYKVPKAPQA